MAKNNGHLTKHEHQLNREANHMSKRIYKDKHNARPTSCFWGSRLERAAAFAAFFFFG
jgi:hypothetical protein